MGEEAAFWSEVSALYNDFTLPCRCCLWPVLDSRWRNLLEWPATGSLQTDGACSQGWDTPGNNSLHYGLGWLSNMHSFQNVKNSLKLVHLVHGSLQDVVGGF